MAFPLYNVKFILLISASFITIFSSIAIYFCLPILISHVVRTQLSLSSSSGSFNDWRLNSVVDRIYLYNITNLDDLFSDAARHPSQRLKPIPKLKQIGPFTFKQEREKINIRFDIKNETVIYDQVKRWTYLPELSSVKTREDINSTWIHHINVPLAGTTLNSEYAEFIEPIVSEFELKLFQKHTADLLLFDGYYDILMEQAKSGGQIEVDKFGWMYNQNNSVTKNIRVFTGPSNATLDKLGAIDQFEYSNHFKVWHNNGSDPKDTSNVQCNEFRFSSAGEFFPPSEHSLISHNNQHCQQNLDNHQADLNNNKHQLKSESMNSNSEMPKDLFESNGKAGKTISLFMPDFCRVFKLFYNSTYNFRGLSVDRYIANEFTYDYTNEDGADNSNESLRLNAASGSGGSVSYDRNPNRCFCIYDENTKFNSCPPNGMMDLFTCRKGSPLTISFPHFLYSKRDSSLAPYMKLFDDEIEPNEDEHQFYIDLESTLNIPVKAQITIQFNVHYRNEPNLNFTRDYSFLVDNPKAQALSNRTLSDIYLPQMWFKSSAEIDENNLNRLKFIQQQLDLVTPITTMVIFGFASILLMMSAKLAYDLTYGPKTRKSISRDQDSCSSLSRNDASFMSDKQKYYAMQLLGGGKSLDNNNNHGNNHDDRSNKPTTSKVHDYGGENQPLNG